MKTFTPGYLAERPLAFDGLRAKPGSVLGIVIGSAVYFYLLVKLFGWLIERWLG
jgi:hypothetical protein